MAILGSQNNGLGNTRNYTPTTARRMDVFATLEYVAGHSVLEGGVFLASSVAADETVVIGIYNISSGVAGAPLIYSLPITATSASTAGAYVSVTGLSDSLPGLVGGETLALALAYSAGSSLWPGRRVNVSTSLGGTGTGLVDPWTEVSTSGVEAPDAYFEIGEAGPSVATTDNLSPGTSITISASNFVNPLTGARITDSAGNVKELTLATQTSVSAPAVGNLDYVLYGDVTLEAYNATESATTTIAFNLPAGFSLVALEAGFVTTQESYLYNYGGTPAVPDQFAYNPTASDTGETLTLGSDGLWTATGGGTWEIYGTDATDGMMQSFSFVWSGELPSVGRITRRALTRRNITRRSLTARP